MAWVHRLSNIDTMNRLATCSNCGDVTMRRSGKFWRCSVSHNAGKRGIKGVITPRPDRCEICAKQGTVVADHNHATGMFRGWICSSCNLILGMLKDKSDLLPAIKNYLNK